MTFVRRLTTDIAFYSVLGALQRAVTILLVPIYTRVLSQQDFGNLDLIIAACGLVQVLVDLQQAKGFMRFYAEHVRAGSERRFVGTNLITRLALGAFIAALFVGLGLGGYLERSFIPSFGLWRTTWIVAVATIPASLIGELLLLQTRLLGSRRLFATGALSNVLLSTIVCMILVAGLGWGLFGAVVGQCTGTIVSAFLLVWSLRTHITIAWDANIMKGVLRHTLPIVPGYWLASFSVHLCRFFMFGEMGAAQAAILAICLKVVGVVSLFSVSFRMAWQPLAMMNLGDERSDEQFSEAMRVFLIGGLLCVCGLAILAGPVVALLAPASYADASRYVTLFAFASIIGEIEASLQLGNQVAGKTFWLSVSAIAGFAVNVVALASFTRVLGIGAAVIGAIVSAVVGVSVAYASSQANHRIRYYKGAFLRFGVGCMLVGTITLFRGIISSAILTALLASIGVCLSWMSLKADEKRLIRGLIAVL